MKSFLAGVSVFTALSLGLIGYVSQSGVSTTLPAASVAIAMADAAPMRHGDRARLEFNETRSYDGPVNSLAIKTVSYGYAIAVNPPNETPLLFIVQDPTAPKPVDDDQQLPLKLRAFSSAGNPASIVSPVWGINDPTMGSVAAPTPQRPDVWYFVPAGKLGACTITVSGLNKRGKPVPPGTLLVEVLAGAASVTAPIQIEALPVEDK